MASTWKGVFVPLGVMLSNGVSLQG
jgi:hypothetical protein